MDVWRTLRFGARALLLQQRAASSPELIEAIQRRRLASLVRYAKEHSNHFREKFAGVDPDDFDLTDLPTSSKSELMEHFDDVLTVDEVKRTEVEQFFEDENNLGKLFRDKYALSHTSGSQGQPLLLVKSSSDFELMFALQASRGHCEALGLREYIKRFAEPVRLAAVTMQPGFYPSSSAFDYLPDGVKAFIKVLQVSLTDDNLIERLAEFRPTHLTAYASILHELARQTEAGQLSLAGDLQQVVNISERLMPAARKRYQELFDAPILDDYGMGECLFLTNGCLTSGGMHVNADWAIMEVVDEENQPVPAGERGAKILLTNLANRIQPFIRYEVGDVVVMATEPCECGSQLPLIDHVEGRSSDMFYIEKDGELRGLPPAIVQDALGHITEIREYQLIQHEPARLRVRLEPIPGEEINTEEAKRIIDEQLTSYELKDHLQVEVEVVERVGPEPGEGKFKRVVANVEPPGC